MDSDPKFKRRPAFNYTHVLSYKNPIIRRQMGARKVKPPSPTIQQLKELHKKVDRVYDLLIRLAVFQGCPVDTPESSHTNMAEVNLLENREGGEDEEENSDNDETDYTDADSQNSEDGESNSEDEDVRDGIDKASMEVVSCSEYNPDDDD